MTTKQILLTGKFTQHGFTLDYAPRQETLYKCPVCDQHYDRNDMQWVGEKLVCVDCAGDEEE